MTFRKQREFAVLYAVLVKVKWVIGDINPWELRSIARGQRFISMIKFGIVTLTMFMSIGVNLSNGIMHRLGFDPDILLAALVAFAVAGMISRRNIALSVLVVLMTMGANVSEQTALSIGYNPDYLLVGLVVLVLLPFVCKRLEGRLF